MKYHVQIPAIDWITSQLVMISLHLENESPTLKNFEPLAGNFKAPAAGVYAWLFVEKISSIPKHTTKTMSMLWQY